MWGDHYSNLLVCNRYISIFRVCRNSSFLVSCPADSCWGLESTESRAESYHTNFDKAFLRCDVRSICSHLPYHRPTIGVKTFGSKDLKCSYTPRCLQDRGWKRNQYLHAYSHRTLYLWVTTFRVVTSGCLRALVWLIRNCFHDRKITEAREHRWITHLMNAEEKNNIFDWLSCINASDIKPELIIFDSWSGNHRNTS